MADSAENKKLPPPRAAKVGWDPRAQITVSEIFAGSKVCPPSVAKLAELVTNQTDRDSIQDPRPTIIDVWANEKSAGVSGIGGKGGDDETIDKAAHYGATDLDNVDGVASGKGGGGRSALKSMGKDASFKAKLPGSNVEWSALIKKFGTPEGDDQPFAIIPSLTKQPIDRGYFEAVAEDIKDPTSLATPAKLINAFARMYRPRLVADPIKRGDPKINSLEVEPRIRINRQGEKEAIHDKFLLYVQNKTRHFTQVTPLEIPLDWGSEELEVAWTENNEPIGFWVGDKNPETGKGIRGKFHFYLNGCEVHEGEGGHDLSDHRTKGVIGEVHIDHVKGILSVFGPNKAGGPNEEHPIWERIERTVFKATQEKIEIIKARHAITHHEAPNILKQTFGEVRKVVDSILMVEAEDEEAKGKLLPSNASDGVAVKTATQRSEENKQPGQTSNRERETIGHRLNVSVEPGVGKKKRPSSVDDITTGVLSDPDEISTIEVDDHGKRLLVLNEINAAVIMAPIMGKLGQKQLIGTEIIKHGAEIQAKENLSRFKQMFNRRKGELDRRLLNSTDFQVEQMAREKLEEAKRFKNKK